MVGNEGRERDERRTGKDGNEFGRDRPSHVRLGRIDVTCGAVTAETVVLIT